MPVTITCDRCRKPFDIPPSWVGQRRFCSSECREAERGPVTLICETCGKSFETEAYRLKRKPRFCGRRCANRRPLPTLAERMWPKVDTSGECWVFTGARSPAGYGRFQYVTDNGHVQVVYTHRIAFEEASERKLAPGEGVFHTCDNPPCVRNDERGTYEVKGRTFERYGHLFAATQIANTTDRDTKDRVRHGSRHASAKLTESDITRIRTLHATGAISQRKLATLFRVSHQTVSDILNGKTWRRA